MKEWITNLLGRLPYSNYLENKYILSLLILITFVLLAKLVLFIFVHYFKKIASKTKTNVDDLIFERTEKPIFL
ncbi:MAG: hypothetical protein KJ598_03485, partial [Nanoarchaeota archaeon]|nr:hypothetical protein [Nanoarchaeota archaeon]